MCNILGREVLLLIVWNPLLCGSNSGGVAILRCHAYVYTVQKYCNIIFHNEGNNCTHH